MAKKLPYGIGLLAQGEDYSEHKNWYVMFFFDKNLVCNVMHRCSVSVSASVWLMEPFYLIISES